MSERLATDLRRALAVERLEELGTVFEITLTKQAEGKGTAELGGGEGRLCSQSSEREADLAAELLTFAEAWESAHADAERLADPEAAEAVAASLAAYELIFGFSELPSDRHDACTALVPNATAFLHGIKCVAFGTSHRQLRRGRGERGELARERGDRRDNRLLD